MLGGLNVRGQGELILHNNIVIAAECLAITSSHNYNGNQLPFAEDDNASGIEIEDHVWVGQRVTLLPGTRLREGCIIQAGAVVHGEIPACSIAGGNPAKVFKMRDEEIYQKLKKEYENNRRGLSDVKGLLVTTIGKLCDSVHYDDAYNSFNKDVDRKKIYFVEHEAKGSIDNGTWKEDLITLRKLNYKNANSVVINPHYFGEGVKVTDKNEDVTNFITIGALRAKRKNSGMLVEAAEKLHNKGITNFRITVVGKGKLKDLPKHLRKYFDIKGRLQYGKMYSEIEKSDYLLTAYDSQNPAHQRYVTTGTSGNFQLVFGFLKPCVIDT